nr:BTB/POZ domain-containing protein KCTD16-like [Cherax quadricarinatus]
MPGPSHSVDVCLFTLMLTLVFTPSELFGLFTLMLISVLFNSVLMPGPSHSVLMLCDPFHHAELWRCLCFNSCYACFSHCADALASHSLMLCVLTMLSSVSNHRRHSTFSDSWNQKLVLPENFSERERLKKEADFFQLQDMIDSLSLPKSLSPVDPAYSVRTSAGTITVSYRGTFAFGRDGLADVKFRKLSRILVCGRVTLCREVFGETLNESRDPDRGATDRYTARFFLKHTFLEQAFDMLVLAGYKCCGSCGNSTAGGIMVDKKPGMDNEEDRWNHYNEFVWVRE